ncbi:hypothetical protein C2845_PM14G07930 [Panicum miliaceum]|uniref:Replication protein A 70 kDa DNA-binding subunit B/D first OB fold domain-containing protein n=1 Tax=Panicum miliaceum TaxID=4540 RepID=A0A3L6PTC3_PANMI|nr:hypothetical protein C2845_PM14G07930 [Panicum miliaceum]
MAERLATSAAILHVSAAGTRPPSAWASHAFFPPLPVEDAGLGAALDRLTESGPAGDPGSLDPSTGLSCVLVSPCRAQPASLKFDEIKLRDVSVSWSIIVRLDVKFPVQAHREMQHFILTDATGSKIEAIVRGDDISRFNKLLTEGCTYNIHEVRFQIMSKVEYRNIRSHYVCYFDHVTKVDPYYGNIQFSLYPKYVMSFSEVGYCRRNTFVDIAGIVVHWGNLERGRTLYREVVLMDARIATISG